MLLFAYLGCDGGAGGSAKAEDTAFAEDTAVDTDPAPARPASEAFATGNILKDGEAVAVVAAPEPSILVGGRESFAIYPGIPEDGASLSTVNGTLPDFASVEAVASVGDLNGDGADEMFVTWYDIDVLHAYAVILPGGLGSIAWIDIRTEYAFECDGRPANIAAARDLDGDGVFDVAIGSTDADAGLVFSVAKTGTVTESDAWFRVDIGTAGMPTVAFPGDLDGDGVEDFAVGVGTVDFDPAAAGTGVFLGARTGTHAMESADFVVRGAGRAVAGAGDLNGDGRPELVAGAPGAVVDGSTLGGIKVYSGWE